MSRYRVRNWSEYNRSLENRGNLSLWVEEGALEQWFAPREPGVVGAPMKYSDTAILFLLTLKAIYHQPFRQLVGFISSFFRVGNILLPVPHFTTIAHRSRTLAPTVQKLLSNKKPTDIVLDSTGLKVYGEGEWHVRQHGKTRRRGWKKFHVALDPRSQEIICSEVTGVEGADCKVGERLIRKAPRSVKRTVGDGAYDTEGCYRASYEKGARHLSPPRTGSVIRHSTEPWRRHRDEEVSAIKAFGDDTEGIKLWKKLTGYHRRSLVETTFSRYKRIFGSKLFSQHADNQLVEVLLKAMLLNRMTRMGMPAGSME